MSSPPPSSSPPSDPVSPPAPTTAAPPPSTTPSPPPPTTTITPPPPDAPSPPPPSTTPPASPPPSDTPSPPPPTTTATPPPPSTPSPPPPTETPATPPPPSTPTPPPPSITPSTAPPPSTTPSPPPPTTTTSPPPSSTPSPPPPSTSAPPPSTSVTSPPPPSSSHSPPPPSTGTTPPPSVSTPSPPTDGSSSSPPPPHGTSDSPPSPSSSSNSPPPPPPSSSSPSTSSVSTGVVVGVVVGGVVILAVLGLLFFLLARKKRRRDDRGGENFNTPPPPHSGPKDGGAQANLNYSQPPDHYIIPKPSTQLPGMTLSQRNQTPPYISSSGGSAYSGSEPPLPPPPGMVLGFSKNMFTYEELAMATDGFSDANLLGQGGFGYVHKGVLPTGKEVAVKSLKAGSGQGEREFQAEVEIISRVHHKHLVSLVGYCMSGSQRMLVYEFVPNGTLEFHLHGKDRPTLDWLVRLRIALGAAKGLAYLHEDCHPKIIHRDIKGSNILVDFKFESKVADFGLAKLCSDFDTHISTRVMGTFGYLAPEYASSGKLTEKSDVFSFGVVLLELITGRRPVTATHTNYVEDSLVDWARPLLARALEDGNFEPLVDERLQQSYDNDEMARMVTCAAACVRHSARRRPKMSQIVRSLEGDVSLSDLNEGVRPGQSSVYGSYGGSTDYDSGQYREDMKKFKKTLFGGTSQEYGSSEYGGTSSDYGHNPSGTSSEGRMTREMEMERAQRESQGFSGTSSGGVSGERHRTSAEQRSER